MNGETCLHPATEPLGHQADTSFERCRLCGRILIFQRGRGWMLRPRLPAA